MYSSLDPATEQQCHACGRAIPISSGALAKHAPAPDLEPDQLCVGSGQRLSRVRGRLAEMTSPPRPSRCKKCGAYATLAAPLIHDYKKGGAVCPACKETDDDEQ